MLNEKERLNRANFAGPIFEKQVMIIKVGAKRLRNDLIKAMILAFVAKGILPRLAMLELSARENSRDALRKSISRAETSAAASANPSATKAMLHERVAII